MQSLSYPLLGTKTFLSSILVAAVSACSGEGARGRPSDIPGLAPSGPGLTAAPSSDPSASESPTTDVDPAPSTSAEFELLWQDDFDSFDAARWQLMTHSWDTNLALFSDQNVRMDAGIASLLLTAEPADTLKPFRGVEMRSRETLTYGKVEARARFARGSGIISALVLIYTPWPADDWNELDIEYLGRYSDRVQFNAMVYTGPPTQPPVQQSVTPMQFPQLSELGFDAAADFHVYSIEWTPDEARFSVDGIIYHVWESEIERLRLPMNILLTIWASSAATWAGALEAGSVPVGAEYDWLRVYRWNAPSP